MGASWCGPFMGSRIRRRVDSRYWTTLLPYEILLDCPATDWRLSPATELASTVSGSTASGEYASAGKTTDRTTWRSWTTTDEELDMSTSNGMRPVHPGEILAEELEELGLSANALAKALDVPTNRVTAILKGQRGVTADTALRLARYFGTTPQLWQNLQKAFELRVAEIESGPQIERRVQRRETARVGGT